MDYMSFDFLTITIQMVNLILLIVIAVLLVVLIRKVFRKK